MSRKIKKINTSESWGNNIVTDWWNKPVLPNGTIALHNDKYVRLHDGVTPGGNPLPLSGANATDQVGDKNIFYSAYGGSNVFSGYSVNLLAYGFGFTPQQGDYMITAEGKRLTISQVTFYGDSYTIEWPEGEDYYVDHNYYQNKFFPVTVYLSLIHI